jgi:hypothetical protein
MKKINEESREQLKSKIDEISGEVNKILKKHGLDNINVSAMKFAPGPVVGQSCGAPGSGKVWTWDCSSDPCVLKCM